MASPAELTQTAPDTLPADFGDWDNEIPAATLPVDTSGLEPKEAAPKAPAPKEAAPRSFTPREAAPSDLPAKDFAPRDAGPRPAPRDFTGRVIDIERGTAPIPRPPVPAPDTRSYPAAQRSPRPMPAAAQTANFPDEEAILRRIRNVNTAVDKLPVTVVPSEEELKEKAAKQEAAALERAQLREASESLFRTYATETAPADETDEEQENTRKKWMVITAVAAGCIGLVAFQLFHAGTVSKVTHIVAPQTTATSTDTSADVAVPDPASVQHTALAKPSPATQAQVAPSSDPSSDPSVGQASGTPAPVQAKMMHDQLLAPTRIPQGARAAAGADAPPAAGFGGASMAALNGNGTANNVFSGQAQPNVKAGPHVVTVSAGVAVGMLIRKTPPTYPPIAKSARVQGTVVLEATITRTGTVTNIRVVSGHAMLRQAAIDAVKTWRYKPYQLNNEPTDVETTINVIFALNG